MLIRSGISCTGMRVTSLIACTSIAVIDLVPQVETYTVLLSGVKVIQAGPPPLRALSRNLGFRQGDMSHQLEVGERVDENGIGRPAVGPESLIVRRDADAVADAFATWREPGGFVGILDSRHFFVRRKIHHGESVRSIQVVRKSGGPSRRGYSQ